MKVTSAILHPDVPPVNLAGITTRLFKAEEGGVELTFEGGLLFVKHPRDDDAFVFTGAQISHMKVDKYDLPGAPKRPPPPKSPETAH